MPQFQASLRDLGGVTSIYLSAEKDAALITDSSNYDDTGVEDGHDRSDFSAWREMEILQPNGTTSLLFNTLLTGIYNFPAPSVGPDDLTWTPSAGKYIPDGLYKFTLRTVPLHDEAIAYQASDDYVCTIVDGGVHFYKCILDAPVSAIAVTDTDYWEEVVKELLSSKYVAEEYVAITSAIDDCFSTARDSAVCALKNDSCGDKALMANKCFMKYWKMQPGYTALYYFIETEEWGKVSQVLNVLKNICCNCGCGGGC